MRVKFKPPRYDEVYYQGLAVLDSMDKVEERQTKQLIPEKFDMAAARKRLAECIKRQKVRKFPYTRKAWYGYKPRGLINWYKTNEHRLPLDFTEKEA